MKRSIVIVTALAMAFAMTACNASGSKTSVTTEAPVTETTTEATTTTEETTESTSDTSPIVSEEPLKPDGTAYIKGIAGVWIEDTELDARVMKIEEDGSFTIEFRGGGAMFGTINFVVEDDKPVFEFVLGYGDIMKVNSVAEPGKQEMIEFDSKDFLSFSREKQN